MSVFTCGVDRTFADTPPPGLNTPHSVDNLSIAVQDGVGITLTTPSGGGVGSTPNVFVPGNVAIGTTSIAPVSSTVSAALTVNGDIAVLGTATQNGPCVTVGLIAQDGTGLMLSCQSSGANLLWQPAFGGGGNCPSQALPVMSTPCGNFNVTLPAGTSNMTTFVSEPICTVPIARYGPSVTGYNSVEYQCLNGTWTKVPTYNYVN